MIYIATLYRCSHKDLWLQEPEPCPGFKYVLLGDPPPTCPRVVYTPHAAKSAEFKTCGRPMDNEGDYELIDE